MFKLFVFAAVVAVAAAGHLHGETIVRSYGSPLIISRSPLVRSYASAPIIKRIETPIIKSYLDSGSFVKSYSSPIIKTYGSASLLRTPIVREANFLKTHAESAGGVKLSTFESRPTYLGDRLAFV